MKAKLVISTRIILGLFMIIIGLNKFLVFTEIPNPPGLGGELMQIYISSGFLKLIGLLEILGGLGLLLNRFTAIALTFITAIMFNATIFHAFHDLSGIGPAVFCLFLCSFLIISDKDRFFQFTRWKI